MRVAGTYFPQYTPATCADTDVPTERAYLAPANPFLDLTCPATGLTRLAVHLTFAAAVRADILTGSGCARLRLVSRIELRAQRRSASGALISLFVTTH